jgi:hypothetical protein
MTRAPVLGSNVATALPTDEHQGTQDRRPALIPPTHSSKPTVPMRTDSQWRLVGGRTASVSQNGSAYSSWPTIHGSNVGMGLTMNAGLQMLTDGATNPRVRASLKPKRE